MLKNAVDGVAVEVNGCRCGDAVRLGQRFIFYTALPDLAQLDGKRFNSLKDIEVNVRVLMNRMQPLIRDSAKSAATSASRSAA